MPASLAVVGQGLIGLGINHIFALSLVTVAVMAAAVVAWNVQAQALLQAAISPAVMGRVFAAVGVALNVATLTAVVLLPRQVWAQKTHPTAAVPQ